jgi:alpha-beta hydrolase superfamily lysophospholipase
MSTESTLSTFIACDGDNIAVQEWPLARSRTRRGTVIIVHGLGEHAGRFDTLAQRLNEWDFAVRGYDQYGHGESGGVRGGLPTDDRLLLDLADMVDSVAAKKTRKAPIILLGHSLGGLVAAKFVMQNIRPVDGLVMSSPALNPGLTRVQKAMLAVLPRVVPNMRVNNGVVAEYLSRDPAVVRAYLEDPLVHDRISARLGRFVADSGAAVVAGAATWALPTLLLFAGADKLVNPAGSRAFAAAAPLQAVTTRAFETMFHEVFNEPDSVRVYAELKAWLDLRF